MGRPKQTVGRSSSEGIMAGSLFSSRMVTAGAAALGAGLSVTIWNSKNQTQYARNWSSDAHMKYPASANYPDLSWHNNRMADHLTPAIYSKLRGKKTSNGRTFDQCIQTGVDNPGYPSFKTFGLVAGDEESYALYSDLFDLLIEDYHGHKAEAKHVTDLDPNKIVGGVFDE